VNRVGGIAIPKVQLMSDIRPQNEKSLLARITTGVAQATALVVALTTLFLTFPALNEGARSAWCLVTGCSNTNEMPHANDAAGGKLGAAASPKPVSDIVTPDQKAKYLDELSSNNSEIARIQIDIEQNDTRAAQLHHGLEDHAGQIASQELRLSRGEGSRQEREEAIATIGNAKVADAQARAALARYDQVKADSLAKIGQLGQRNREIKNILGQAAH